MPDPRFAFQANAPGRQHGTLPIKNQPPSNSFRFDVSTRLTATRYSFLGKTKKAKKQIFGETLRPDSKRWFLGFSPGKSVFSAQSHFCMVFAPKTNVSEANPKNNLFGVWPYSFQTFLFFVLRRKTCIIHQQLKRRRIGGAIAAPRGSPWGVSKYICIYGCMYIFIYTYVYTHIHIYIYTYLHIYLYAYMHLCIYTYIHIHIHIYICIYIHQKLGSNCARRFQDAPGAQNRKPKSEPRALKHPEPEFLNPEPPRGCEGTTP